MKFKFNVKVGDQLIQIEDEAANPLEFWRIKAFWDSLPQAGPNGESDLRFSHRTPKGYEYFAIECPSAGQEFKFGQLRNEKDKLFPKDWAPIMHGRDEFDEEPAPAPQPARQAPVPNTQRSPAPASNVTDIDSKKYFSFQRENGIDFKQAEELRLACTVSGKTHWNRAFEELRKLASPTGALTPGQISLNKIFSDLRQFGMSEAELEAKLSRVCDGLCEIESLDETQTAKAISVFNRDLQQAKQAEAERSNKRTA